MRSEGGYLPRIGPLAATLLAAGACGLFAPSSASAGDFTVRGSVEQVHVSGADPDEALRLVDRHGRVVDSQQVGSLESEPLSC